ncbi:MAG: hypothetical protein WC516_06970 [Patescibacteria group bacterium]|jgi:hypothetical protein
MKTHYGAGKMERLLESILEQFNDNGINVEDMVPEQKLIEWAKDKEINGIWSDRDIQEFASENYEPGDVFTKEQIIEWCKNNLESGDLV